MRRAPGLGLSRNLLFWLVTSWCVSGCGPAKPGPTPDTISTTYRLLVGASMGAIGTAAVGLTHPDRFDGMGALGGPMDASFFFRMMDDFTLGGFCSLKDLEALKDQGALNDVAKVQACSHRATPITWEHSQDFNHWHFTTSGDDFDRSQYLNLITDLCLAYGNFFGENPASPYAPPSVPADLLKHPERTLCTSPIKVKNAYNAEFNPEGKYDAITFCDGQLPLFRCSETKAPVDFCADPRNRENPLPYERTLLYANNFCAGQGTPVVVTNKNDPLYLLDHAGNVDPCREPVVPVTVMLAIDLNGNGRRDYGEPVLNNGRERFDDVGADGCADDFEDGQGGCQTSAQSGRGDPNGDDYDALKNPMGTERDWVWETGEPYRDFGLDGVPGTKDIGEGNGQYDVSLGRRSLLELDARANLKKLDAKALGRLDFFLDGGIRDVFNLGLMSHQVFGLLKALRPSSRAVGAYRDFAEVPGTTDRNGQYNPWTKAWTRVPRDVEILYGKDAPTDEDRVAGDGDHVGTIAQAAARFYSVFNWAAVTWPSLPQPKATLGSQVDREPTEWYQSKILGAKREYGIVLPPGYELPENKDARYPVVYMLHGYGMAPKAFTDISVLTTIYTMDPDVQFRPMILVFPSGKCCLTNRDTGERDCRETDDLGRPLDAVPGFERECVIGNFFINRHGYDGSDNTRYSDALFELMDHIDEKYRTLPRAEVTAR